MTSIHARRLDIAAGFVIATLLASGIAVAAPAEDLDTNKVLVSTHGLDLSSPIDQALLQQRIERAARRVCGWYEPGISSSSDSYLECRNAAIMDASAQLKVLVARAAGETLVANQ